MKPKTFFITLICGMLFLGYCTACFDSKKTETKKEEPIVLTKEQEDLLQSLEADGYITLKLMDNEIWVEDFFWNTCKYDAKYNLGLLSAVKCQEARGNDLYYCTIISNRSGKKLAKWSKAWGFEVY